MPAGEWVLIFVQLFLIIPPAELSQNKILYHCWVCQYIFLIFETGSFYAAEAGLELTQLPRLALNLWPSYLTLLSTGMADIASSSLALMQLLSG
jgi:hypothetical protein